MGNVSVATPKWYREGAIVLERGPPAQPSRSPVTGWNSSAPATRGRRYTRAPRSGRLATSTRAATRLVSPPGRSEAPLRRYHVRPASSTTRSVRQRSVGERRQRLRRGAGSRPGGGDRSPTPPYQAAGEVFTAARRADPLAQAAVAEVAPDRAPHRAGRGRRGRRPRGARRRHRADGELLWSARSGHARRTTAGSPPRSGSRSLGEPPRCSTARAIGSRTALDDVFVNGHAEAGSRSCARGATQAGGRARFLQALRLRPAGDERHRLAHDLAHLLLRRRADLRDRLRLRR